MAVVVEYICVGCGHIYITCIISLGIGAFILGNSIVEDLKTISHSINKSSRNKRKQVVILKQVSELVYLHSFGKQLSESVIAANKYVLWTFWLFWQRDSTIFRHGSAYAYNTLCIHHGGNVCWNVNNSKEISYAHQYIFYARISMWNPFSLLQLHQEMSCATQLLVMFQTIYGFGAVLISCDLGQRMSDRWGEINSTIVQLKWYLFPNELKRFLPIIIAAAQQPVKLVCFGRFSLSREVFKKVGAFIHML